MYVKIIIENRTKNKRVLELIFSNLDLDHAFKVDLLNNHIT